VAGEPLGGVLDFVDARFWDVHRPLLDSLNFAHGRSRAGKNARESRFDFMSPVVASMYCSPCCPLRSTLTRRPAPGLLRLGFRAWEMFVEENVEAARQHDAIA
jgi:hypothetical protein